MSGESTAWIRGHLQIKQDVLAQFVAHAEAEYPSEACGFFLGPLEDAPLLDRFEVALNEADRYHALDPETFPRSSNTYFKLNELKAQRRFESAQTEGLALKVIVHSHCDAGAYFSEEDAATFSQNGALMWPCAFIVTSVMKGTAQDTQLWVFDPATAGFVPSPLTILP